MTVTTTLERLRGRLSAPQRKLARTIYIDPAGDDDNSGVLGEPVATFPRAIELWERIAAARPGPVTVQSAASSTYTLSEALDFDDALVLDSPLTIAGAVDDSNIPTVVIQGSEDGSRTISPILATEGVGIGLQNVKLQSFSSALRSSRGGRITATNVHALNVNRVVSLGNKGWADCSMGVWDGRDLDGNLIADNTGLLSVIVSAWDLTQPNDYSGLVIKFFDRCLVAGEACSGHCDYTQFTDATTAAIEFTRANGMANLTGVKILRSPIGIIARSAANLLLSDDTDFGQGTVDACTDPVVYTAGPTNPQIENTNFDTRPLFQARAKADGGNITGDTNEHTITQTCFIVPSRMRTRDTLDMYLSGTCSGGLVAAGTLRLYVGASSIKSFTLPIGATAWRIRVSLIATSKTTVRGMIEVVDDTAGGGGNTNLIVVTSVDGSDKVSLSANTEVKMTWQAGDSADNFAMADHRIVTTIAGIATS